MNEEKRSSPRWKSPEGVLVVATLAAMLVEPYCIGPLLAQQDPEVQFFIYGYLSCCFTPFAGATTYFIWKSRQRQKSAHLAE